MGSKKSSFKKQSRVTRGQKRMKLLLEFKEALAKTVRFTENPALDADYADLGKQIDQLIIAEGREQEQAFNAHKKEPHDSEALNKEIMVNMIVNAFKRPETLKECLQSVEK